MSPTPHDLEPCSWLSHQIGRLVLWALGWTAQGEVPPGRRFVVVAAPHTSYWDYPIAQAFAWKRGFRLQTLVKHTAFWGPLGPLLRALGCIPVDRRAHGGLVEQLAKRIQAADRIALIVPPTGTRTRTEFWKSGFYHITRAAEVPLVCCTCDYSTRTVEILDCFLLTGDLHADMDRLRALYRPEQARHPEWMSVVRLREELE